MNKITRKQYRTYCNAPTMPVQILMYSLNCKSIYSFDKKYKKMVKELKGWKK